MEVMPTTIEQEKYIPLSNLLPSIMPLLHRFTASRDKEEHNLMLLEMLFKVVGRCKEII
jgi:hypothetical protein